MSALVDAVRANTHPQCLATRCQGDGVSARLNGVTKERVLVNVDCEKLDIDPKTQRCDFILAYGEDGVAAIELKRGDVELAQVARQLTGGGLIADRRLLPGNSPGLRFRPVVVYRGKFNRPKGRKPTEKEKVKFRGKLYEIKAIRSKAPLAEALRGS